MQGNMNLILVINLQIYICRNIYIYIYSFSSYLFQFENQFCTYFTLTFTLRIYLFYSIACFTWQAFSVGSWRWLYCCHTGRTWGWVAGALGGGTRGWGHRELVFPVGIQSQLVAPVLCISKLNWTQRCGWSHWGSGGKGGGVSHPPVHTEEFVETWEGK